MAENRKTWSQWRGYDRVRIHKGDPDGVTSVIESLFFRGMDGDRTASGGRKEVVYPDSTGKPVPDADPLAGTARVNTTFAADGTVREKEVTCSGSASSSSTPISTARGTLPIRSRWMSGWTAGTATTNTRTRPCSAAP
ncbi:hypothetical protein [Micromonospora sp. HM5-17]|uniref:hypothetical protein n=1 Tax=Micromonospora sp. HM5-17 TaxID=2487710 RepID=UPI000F47ED81|nr:hypothetical protein [Micromonospora sp. HM5-17]ROT28148.1 hypothetical protein EF879_21260 [Micromonospora sp. HM5-17]